MYLKQDLLFGLRGLCRDRGFGLTAILVLGLGIGVNNMLFTLIYGHTLRGLPIPRADRVLHISTIDDRGADRGLSAAQLDSLRAAREVTGVAAFATSQTIIGDEGRAPERLLGAYVSANAFELIGVAPIFGRSFTPEEDRLGSAPVVIIGNDVWRSRYSSEAPILGRSILVNGVPSTVVGVMPDRSGFPTTAAVWLPLSQVLATIGPQRDGTRLQGFGRVEDGRAIADARAEIESIIATTAVQDATSGTPLRAHVVPISEHFFGRATDPAWLAFISVGFLVLVVSCANTANLMLARSVSRSREIAVRSSLGASRTRIIAQLLTEAVVIAAFGGAIGIVVSLVGVRAFAAWVPQGALPYWLHYGMDGRVFAALVSVSFGTVLIFGLVPAIQASRADVNQLLKSGGRGTSRHATRRLTTGFLAAQLALTVILLCYAVNDIRTSSPELVSDAAIRSTDILSASITLPPGGYPSPNERRIFLQRVIDGVAAISSVESATLTTALPLRTSVEQRVEVEGQPLGTGEAGATVWTVAIAPRYFETLSLPMLAGREFSAGDGLPGRTRALVNERFVELYLTGTKPLGRRIRLNHPNKQDPKAEWLEIIGVTHSIRQRLTATPDPIVYTPLHALAPPSPLLMVRSRARLEPLVAMLRDTVRALDANLPLYNVMTMNRAAQEVEWVGRVSSGLFRFLTLVALALSIVGLYAVTTHLVGQRAQEIGVRMALGAQSWQLLRLIVSRAIWQVGLGLVLGLLGTMAWDGLFFSGRADLRFASPEVLGPVALLLIVITIAACALPMRRVIRFNPVAVLRED